MLVLQWLRTSVLNLHRGICHICKPCTVNYLVTHAITYTVNYLVIHAITYTVTCVITCCCC